MGGALEFLKLGSEHGMGRGQRCHPSWKRESMRVPAEHVEIHFWIENDYGKINMRRVPNIFWLELEDRLEIAMPGI